MYMWTNQGLGQVAPMPTPGTRGGAPTLQSCRGPLILDRFLVGDYRLRPHHYTALLTLRGLTGSDLALSIEGHTDNTGAEIMNTGLSLNRALEVQRYLSNLGVALHTEINAVGEGRPLASNATEAGRQRNRRVELRICRLVQPPPPPIYT